MISCNKSNHGHMSSANMIPGKIFHFASPRMLGAKCWVPLDTLGISSPRKLCKKSHFWEVHTNFNQPHWREGRESYRQIFFKEFNLTEYKKGRKLVSRRSLTHSWHWKNFKFWLPTMKSTLQLLELSEITLCNNNNTAWCFIHKVKEYLTNTFSFLVLT